MHPTNPQIRHTANTVIAVQRQRLLGVADAQLARDVHVVVGCRVSLSPCHGIQSLFWSGRVEREGWGVVRCCFPGFRDVTTAQGDHMHSREPPRTLMLHLYAWSVDARHLIHVKLGGPAAICAERAPIARYSCHDGRGVRRRRSETGRTGMNTGMRETRHTVVLGRDLGLVRRLDLVFPALSFGLL